MRLLAVELNRFRSRRAIALLVLAAVRARRRPRRDDGVAHPAADRRTTAPTPRPRPTWRASKPEIQQRGPRLPRGPAGLPRARRDGRRLRGRAGPGPDAYYPRDPLDLRHGAVDRRARASPLALVVVEPDGDRRLHVRRRRLGIRLDDQPAALRATTHPGVAGQGGRRDARLRRGRAGGDRRLLAHPGAGRPGARTSTCPRADVDACASGTSYAPPRWPWAPASARSR